MKFCSDCKHKYTMSQSPCTECRLFNKMEKGNPAVALLEKLKAEIDLIKDSKSLIDDFDSGCERIKDLLDNHIAELKGE